MKKSARSPGTVRHREIMPIACSLNNCINRNDTPNEKPIPRPKGRYIAESMEERSSVGVDSPAIREMVSMLAQNVPTLPPQRKPTSWGGSPFSAPSQKPRKRITAEADIAIAENLLPFLSEMNPGISWLSAQPMG